MSSRIVAPSAKRMRMTTVEPCDCIAPKLFRSNQMLIKTSGVHTLDVATGSRIIVIRNALDEPKLERYTKSAVQVERVQPKGLFGRDPPRLELCYTVDGRPYKYSGRNHSTTTYPQHVLEVLPSFMRDISHMLYRQHLINPFTVISNGVDIMYSANHERGGSTSAHSDDEEKWGLVLIYSLGQTRYLRVRCINTQKWFNVRLEHNSVVAMYGEHFQRDYTHQIDKLHYSEPVCTRLSLNLRFKSENVVVDTTEHESTSLLD
jgi:alkylated DNA repair dioxygenase AlkB